MSRWRFGPSLHFEVRIETTKNAENSWQTVCNCRQWSGDMWPLNRLEWLHYEQEIHRQTWQLGQASSYYEFQVLWESYTITA